MNLAAILVCYIMLMMPTAYATDVNILHNGELKETVTISPENLVNRQINVIHLPSDITWTNVKVLMSVSSASLAKSISKILIYKCKNNNPIDCIKGEPLEFEAYVDTELSWNDISERTGAGMYPQKANLLMLVKLEGDGMNWVGFWDTIERTNYNVFSTKSSEVGTIDVEAKALELVTPIKNFITSNQMLPITWLESVVFSATSLYGVGGNTDELETKELQGVRPPSTTVTSISKDYFFMFPQTADINHPITINRNPTFQCGKNTCEVALGETQTNCCYDCGCPMEEYCDIRDKEDKSSGTCKRSADIALEVQTVPPVQVSDCTQQVELDISARVLNAPSNLPDIASGRVTLKETPYPVTCTRYTMDSYRCPLTIPSPASCGYGESIMGPNSLSLTITYQDGPNQVSESFERGFGGVTIIYDCACPAGYFCDAVKLKCQPEGSINLGVLSVRSFIDDYNEAGDTINLKLKINNPPSDLDVTGVEYTLGVFLTAEMRQQLQTGDPPTPPPSVTGSVTCTGGADTNHVYDCSIPFSIENYDHTKQYVSMGNSIRFYVSFSSGPETKTKTLSATFSDVTIPSYRCGDGTCHPEENSDNCCFDCGCTATGTYCDKERGCEAEAAISMAVESVSPAAFDGCRVQHEAEIRLIVNNAPSDARIDYIAHKIGDKNSAYPVQCDPINPFTGTTACTLTIPPQDGDCQAVILPQTYAIGPNTLNIKMSYSNGQASATKDMSAQFQDIQISAKAVCGDGTCETNIGETASTCCLDCMCEDTAFGIGDENQYCYYDKDDPEDTGECRQRTDIMLLVDKTETITFDNCEMPNDVELNIHVDSPPASFQLGGWSATLGKEELGQPGTVEDTINKAMVCTKVSDIEYDCKITIEPVPSCNAGTTYRYIENKVSVTAVFNNGRIREMLPLESDFGDIEITQSSRTLFQIMEDYRSQVMSKMADMRYNIDRIINIMETCLRVMIIMALLAVIASLAGAIIGLFASQGVGSDYPSGSKGAQSLGAAWNSAGQAVGKTLTDTTKLICDMYLTYHRVMIEMIEAQMKVDSTLLCMDTYQHNLDTGQCKGNEVACMNQMVGCLNGMSSGLNSHLSSAQSQMNQLNTQANGVVNNIGQAYTSLSSIWADKGSEGTVAVWCNGESISPGSFCCEHSGKVGANCRSSTIALEAPTCDSSKRIIKLIRPDRTTVVTKISWSASDIEDGALSGKDAGEDAGFQFEVYCDKNENKQPDYDEMIGGTDGLIFFNIRKSNGLGGDPECRCSGTTDTTTSGKPGENSVDLSGAIIRDVISGVKDEYDITVTMGPGQSYIFHVFQVEFKASCSIGLKKSVNQWFVSDTQSRDADLDGNGQPDIMFEIIRCNPSDQSVDLAIENKQPSPSAPAGGPAAGSAANVAITSPARGDTVSGTVTVTGTSSLDTVNIYIVRKDTGRVSMIPQRSVISGSWSYEWDTTLNRDGLYVIWVFNKEYNVALGGVIDTSDPAVTTYTSVTDVQVLNNPSPSPSASPAVVNTAEIIDSIVFCLALVSDVRLSGEAPNIEAILEGAKSDVETGRYNDAIAKIQDAYIRVPGIIGFDDSYKDKMKTQLSKALVNLGGSVPVGVDPNIAVPANLHATHDVANGEIDLTWTPVAGYTYEVEAKKDLNWIAITGVNPFINSASIPLLGEYGTFYIRVRAVVENPPNPVSYSTWVETSIEISLTKPDKPTVQFSQQSNVIAMRCTVPAGTTGCKFYVNGNIHESKAGTAGQQATSYVNTPAPGAYNVEVSGYTATEESPKSDPESITIYRAPSNLRKDTRIYASGYLGGISDKFYVRWDPPNAEPIPTDSQHKIERTSGPGEFDADTQFGMSVGAVSGSTAWWLTGLPLGSHTFKLYIVDPESRKVSPLSNEITVTCALVSGAKACT